MEFDGRQVEPAQICALVYHRAEAYGGGASSAWAARVQANVASAKACYQYVAETLLAQQLRQEAELRARDGLTLTECSLAPFDSVGTWIAPVNAPSGSIALRAAVDCTWTAMDGTATTEQRYLAVSLVNDQEDLRPTDCAIFAPRD